MVERVPTTTALGLRPLRMEDESSALAAHAELQADDFPFCLGLEAGMSWSQYLSMLEAHRHGEHLPEGYVPATFLVADVEGEIVGRSSIRHGLNAFLEREGGHIGFGVRPAYRKRGYATAILQQSLVVARAVEINRVLVTCDDDNVASASVIERCGGVLDSVVEAEAGGIPIRRYWIN
jgi:predicted acetyltransferase